MAGGRVLTGGEYRLALQTAHHLRLIAGAAIDWEAAIRFAERADVIGPMIDPTTWIEKRDALDEDIQTLRACATLAGLGTTAEKTREVKP